MSKYVIEINERSRKGKALKIFLENEENVKILPFEQIQEVQIPDSNFKSWDEFNQGFGIGRNNPANLKDIRNKAKLNHLIRTAPKDVPLTDDEIMEEIYASRKKNKR